MEGVLIVIVWWVIGAIISLRLIYEVDDLDEITGGDVIVAAILGVIGPLMIIAYTAFKMKTGFSKFSKKVLWKKVSKK